jgi:fatty acid synthase
VKKFIKTLEDKKIFVREIEGGDLPFHTLFLNTSAEKMTNILMKVIPKPKERSNKWMTTSYHKSEQNDNNCKYASAQYFVNNLLKPVFFYNALITVPKNAIVIEIAPHSLFANIITKTLESVDYIPLLKRNQNDTNLETFLKSIGKLYQLGVNPSIENLYPKVEWPVVRGTPSISSLIKWDHNESYLVKSFPEFHCHSTASDMHFSISLSNTEDKYLMDHCIDGKVIFPATGYLMLAWRRLAASKCKLWSQLAVHFVCIIFIYCAHNYNFVSQWYFIY